MGTKVLKNAKVVLASSNNISAQVKQVTLNYSADTLESTAMGNDTHLFAAGLKNWDISVEFNQDYAASAIDSILFGLVGTEVLVEVWPENAATSTSNPKYSGQGVIVSYPPLNNAVGELASGTLAIQAAGTLSRATS
jgi:hypothetical protein